MQYLYSELFLEDLNKIKKCSTIFLPVGTLEWHGAHLPLGADLIEAVEITKLISRKVKGLILPPLYIGTDCSKIKEGVILSGVDLQLDKKLIGSLYYLKPSLFYKLLKSLISEIKTQGFKKLIIISGHGGVKQIEILNKIKKNLSTSNFKIVIINPFQMIRKKYGARHAGYEETSLLWALRPDLIKKSRETKFNNQDIIILRGEDSRIKASPGLGNKILKDIIKISINLIQR